MNNFLNSIRFAPRWWAVAVNPHFLPRRALFRAMRTAGPMLSGKLLDVGCGDQPYRELLINATDVMGLELDTPENREKKASANQFYDGTTFPFPDNSFNALLCNQVLEHVFDPASLLDEMFRVTQPGGTLILSVPFFWPEHEKPFDSQRFTSFGLTHRLHAAGFEILQQHKLVPGSSALFALAADRINTKVSRLPLLFRIVARILLAAPCSVIGAILLVFPRSNTDIFLDNFVVARKHPESEHA